MQLSIVLLPGDEPVYEIWWHLFLKLSTQIWWFESASQVAKIAIDSLSTIPKTAGRQSLLIWILFLKQGLNIFIENILLPQNRAIIKSPEICIQTDTSCKSKKGQEYLSSGISNNVISNHFWFESPTIWKRSQLGILPENFIVFDQNLNPWRKFWLFPKFGYSVFYIPTQISSINSLTTACLFNNFMYL